MATYVERDGDWVLRPPGRLRGVTLYAFVFRAAASALTALCQRFVDVPSGKTVTAGPLFPKYPFVLLVCADIKKGFSADTDDSKRGWMTERDVGFFVPAAVTANGKTSTAHLLPYLFVDNFPAVLIGREIFGFPKQLAEIDYDSKNLRFTVTGVVTPKSGTTGKAVSGTLIEIRSTQQRSPIPIPGVLDDAVRQILKVVFLALGMPPQQHTPFQTVPMVFLKQFRDTAQRADACHQSLVRAVATIGNFKGGAILTDSFQLTLPSYASIDIAANLGLGAGTTFSPVAAVRVRVDFTLPFGQALWTAP